MVRAGVMAGSALLLLQAGCFDVRSRDPGIEVRADGLGRVNKASNELGITGYWYAYGDRYDYPSRCTQIGMHPELDCSRIDTPAALPQIGFYNTGGKMCTAGRVAIVSSCLPGAILGCESSGPDYSNIWGAGIGLDFGLDVDTGEDPAKFVRRPLDRKAWDAKMHDVAGVSFDLSWFRGGAQGAPHMRVEFPFVLPDGTPLPMHKGTVGLDPQGAVVLPDTTGVLPDRPSPPTEEYPSGSPFWGAKAGDQWADDLLSPVRDGYNEVRFDSLVPPPESEQAYYVVNVRQPLGIQFHIPASKNTAIDYGFCISNLVFFRD